MLFIIYFLLPVSSLVHPNIVAMLRNIHINKHDFKNFVQAY